MAMTLLGLRNDGGGLLCWRRARQLCGLGCYTGNATALFDDAWCLVCEMCRFAVVCVDCRWSLSYVSWRCNAFGAFSV